MYITNFTYNLNYLIMTSLTFFYIFVPILALILLAVNIILSHEPYQEKKSDYVFGLHLFLGKKKRILSKVTLKYPWLTSQFFKDLFQTLLNKNSNLSLWSLNTPPKPHTFINLRLLCGFGEEDNSKEKQNESSTKEKSEDKEVLDELLETIDEVYYKRWEVSRKYYDLSNKTAPYQNDLRHELDPRKFQEVRTSVGLSQEKEAVLDRKLDDFDTEAPNAISKERAVVEDQRLINEAQINKQIHAILEESNIPLPEAYKELIKELEETHTVYKHANDVLLELFDVYNKETKNLKSESDEIKNNKNSENDPDDNDPKGTGLGGSSSTGGVGPSSSGPSQTSGSHRNEVEVKDLILYNAYIIILSIIESLEIFLYM